MSFSRWKLSSSRLSIVNISLCLLLGMTLFYLFILQVQAIWPFTIDDMYITLRYAKHWVEGYGLVWNVSEPPVEGYSNFSFVLLGRLALILGYDPVGLLKSAGIIGLFFTCLAVFAIARMWFVTSLAVIPCLWLLAYKGQILWSVSGLETAVYQALICSAVFFIFRGLGNSFISKADLASLPKVVSDDSIRPSSFLIAGILLALAGLTRPESPALMGLFALLLLINKPRSPCPRYWQSVVLFCATILFCFAPYFLWRWHYYGRFFPNPVYCKGLINPMSFTLDKAYLYLVWPFALLVIPALWQGKDPRYHFLWLPSVLYLVLLMGADPIVAFDNRLFLPAFVLLLPLVLQGLHILCTRYVQHVWCYNLLIYFVGFVVAFFFIPMMTLADYRHFTENPLAGERLRQQVISWLKSNTPMGSRVVLSDSGLIPYNSRYQFIDSYCLNNAAMTVRPLSTMYQRLCEEVLETKPAVIILTGLIEDGTVTYTPADACLAIQLLHSKDYCMQASLGTGDVHSFYRYEIFSKSNKSCSKMQQGR